MVAPGTKSKPNLLVILGETASGKSELAMRIAQEFNGEIIAADSRTIYKGMDIATAKPSLEDQAKIPHHLLDVKYPNEPFTAAEFKDLANKAIKNILSREKLPIMVGGTGLYIDSVLYDFKFGEPADRKLRGRLQKMGVEQLQQELINNGIPLPENSQNPRHLVRQLETGGQKGGKRSLRPRTLIVGLQVPREQLRRSIEDRAAKMISDGLLQEIENLYKKYGWNSEALKAPAYKAFKGYFDGMDSLEKAKIGFIKNDMALAKRQRTWFKRNSSIQWFESPDEAYKFVCSVLNN